MERKSSLFGRTGCPGAISTACVAGLLLFFAAAMVSCTSVDSYIVPDTSETLGAADLVTLQEAKIEVPPPPEDPGPYRLGPEDVLIIRDLDHPELLAGKRSADPAGIYSFPVQADGLMMLPMVGAVQASGKTVPELQSELNSAYMKYVREPNISVSVSQYNSQRVYVLGRVRAPGAYPYNGRISVLDALGLAQGLDEKADLAGSYLVREGQVVPVDLYALLRKGEMQHNIQLAGGDLIQIADAADRKVYVLGEVKKPGVFPMGSEPLRLIDAISMAGGLDLVTAKKGEILLVRGGYADPTVYKLNLSDVMSLTGTETILEPGDRIYATATGLTTWNRFMLQILPFLQGGESASQIKVDLE